MRHLFLAQNPNPLETIQDPKLLETIQDIVEDPFGSAGEVAATSGADAALKAAEVWQETWEAVINSNSGIFQPLVNLASAVAVLCLLFWAVKWVQDLLRDDVGRPTPEFIWVIIVMVLLRGPADLNIAGLASGMRSLINSYNYQIATSMNTALQVDQKLQELATYDELRYKLQDLRSRCNSKVTADELKACLEDTKQQANGMISKFNSLLTPEHKRNRYLGELTTTFQSAWNSPLDTAVNTVQDAFKAVGRMTYKPIFMAIQGLLLLFQVAFHHLIEVSLLITALLGPIAVGATLLPIGGKPLYLWLTSFWSLGLCKISLTVVTGVATYAMYGSGEDTMTVALVISLLAPILAMAMAAGGGMAVFNAIAAAGQSAISIATRII